MGFIYKIEVEREIYIGSTKQKLSTRQVEHNYSLNNPNSKKYNYPLYKFCREKKVKKIICELLETVEDSELRILEQEYIKMLEPSLNTRRVFEIREERLEQHRKQNQKKSNCPICNKEMRKHNINRHINTFHKIDN
jgi:hypothetical protein